MRNNKLIKTKTHYVYDYNNDIKDGMGIELVQRESDNLNYWVYLFSKVSGYRAYLFDVLADSPEQAIEKVELNLEKKDYVTEYIKKYMQD